jgi:hypothetical protein
VPRKSRLKPWFADFVVMNFHNRPPLSIEALKAKKDELERKIVYEVDQIRRLELKEELKKVKNEMELDINLELPSKLIQTHLSADLHSQSFVLYRCLMTPMSMSR